MDIRFEKREHLKEKPDQKHLGFGKYMTDYMFVMDWTKEEGWKDARIPFELAISPIQPIAPKPMQSSRIALSATPAIGASRAPLPSFSADKYNLPPPKDTP